MFQIIKQYLERKTNSLECAISRFRGGKNQYTQLMKNALTSMKIIPRPLSCASRADFVWLHWFEKKAEKNSSQSAIKFLEKCRKKDVKIIWNVHNKIPHESKSIERVKKFMRLLADVSYKIVIHSKITIQTIEELCESDKKILEKIVYVPHPHYIGIYGNQEKDNNLDDKTLKLCFFGAIKKYKGVELLISSINELGYDDIELNIYGRCRPLKYARILRNLAGNNKNIKMNFGFIPDKKIPKILASCHLLVLPYNLDSSLNSGATILAFSYGRSVLSPTTGTLSDIEDKTSFFTYSYNNSEEHKEVLKKQIFAIRESYKGNYNELQKIGEKCKEYISEHNSINQVVKQLKQVFA